MEVTNLKSRLEKIVFNEPKPFVDKRELNWAKLGKLGAAVVGVLVVFLLLLPASEPEETNFHEKADPGSLTKNKDVGDDYSSDALASMNSNRLGAQRNYGSFDYLSQNSGPSVSSGQQREKNGPMIIARAGFDAKNQLPPGARIPVRLLQNAIVANQGMPVIGIVLKDVTQEDSVAIPEGSKILGEISFDDSSDRAQVSWRTLQFADGRERQISGIGVSQDGQVGVEGKIHSDGFKNTAGQLLARFIGAYAEGSMQKGAFGASQGGNENGLKNAVAETAKDRGEAWADDLKKQKRWIELGADKEFLAVINQPFTFRDPGSTNGK